MSKLFVSHKNSQTSVKSILMPGEEVNIREVDKFKTKKINGLMSPDVSGSKLINYKGPAGEPINKFLKSDVTISDFFTVFVQILEVIKAVERNGLNTNNLIFNQKYVFVNRTTKEVNFIYQPIISSNVSLNIFAFLYDVCYTPSFVKEQEVRLVTDLSDFMHHLQIFSADDIEDYIATSFPNAFKNVQRRQPGQSQVLRKHQWDEVDEEKPVDDLATDILVEDDDLGTEVLVDEEDTALLVEEELGTELLVENAERTPVAYLIRRRTNERIEINKPAFRVGKERSYVDYFVESNSAVSRIHIDILTRDNSFFIKDNKSTNGTFVDRRRLQPEVEEEIFDGCEIVLANEEFEFHIDY